MGIKLGNGKWATKEDELLAYRVIEGKYFDRSFDFARSSTTTRVNKDGYIEDVPSDTARIDFADSVDGALVTESASTNLITYPKSFSSSYWTKNGASVVGDSSTAGSELVTNGTFDTDASSWVDDSGANLDWQSDSTLLVGNGGGDNTYAAAQSNVLVSGKTYKVSFRFKPSGLGTLRVRLGGSGTTFTTESFVVDAWNEVELFGTADNTTLEIGSVGGNITNFYLDNVSVKEVQGFDAPRVDGSGYLEKEAYKLVEDSQNSGHFLGISDLNVSNTATVTRSVYAKQGERNEFMILETNNSANCWFDLESGIVGTEYNASGKIEALSNGWYRCSMTSTVDATYSLMRIYLGSGSENSSYQGDGTSGIYIAYAQLEEQASATSLMLPVTEGSTTSRVADACNGSGTAQDFKDYNASGTLYAEIAANSDDLTSRYISLSDGTASNRLFFYYTSTTNRIKAKVVVSDATVSSFSSDLSDITEFSKIGIRYAENDFSLWVDGVEVDTDTSGSVFSANTLTELAFDAGSGGSDFYGKTRALEVLPYMSDEEMETLTT